MRICACACCGVREGHRKGRPPGGDVATGVRGAANLLGVEQATSALVRQRGFGIVSLGTVDAIDSHALWHAYAHTCRHPTLIVARPRSAYVSLGFQRHHSELDWATIRAHDLVAVRREVGGGPVWLDERQLFFQLVIPREDVAVGARGPRLAAVMLSHIARAWHSLGLITDLDRHGEIVLDGRKLCGHGAGEIGSSVVIVGNLLEDFDPQRAAGILALSEVARQEATELMRDHVGPPAALHVDDDVFAACLVDALTDLLGKPHATWLEVDDALLEHYRSPLIERDESSWLRPRPSPKHRTVKIRAGLWLHDVEIGGRRVTLTVREGTLVRLRRAAELPITDASELGSAIRDDVALAGLVAQLGAVVDTRDATRRTR